MLPSTHSSGNSDGTRAPPCSRLPAITAFSSPSSRRSEADAKLAAADGVTIFSLPIQASPGSRRIGIDTPIRSLVQDVKSFEAAGYRFEHAYDY